MGWRRLRLRDGVDHELLASTHWGVATRFHSCRIIGGHRDHRPFGWSFAARCAGSPGDRSQDAVSK